MGAAIVDPDLNASPVSGRPKPPSAGISDDGDDLSNSEKSRKKSR
jgi:hypothetical protein